MRTVQVRQMPGVSRTPPLSASEDESGVKPPEIVTVDYQPKPVFYLPNDMMLVRRAGY
jgi:hypothetical protein